MRRNAFVETLLQQCVSTCPTVENNYCGISPTSYPTGQPSGEPTGQPTGEPTGQPSGQPSVQPTKLPTEVVMRLRQSFTFELLGVTCAEIGDMERTVIADTIFRSCKYTGTTDDGLNQNYIERVDVDGYTNLFRQYSEEDALPLTTFGDYASTVRRLSLFDKTNTSTSTATTTATPVSVMQRTLQSTCDLSANITVVTPESQPDGWDTLLSLVIERLRNNIVSGYFDTVLQLADSNGNGYPDYDGHWTRRLGGLSGATVSSSYGSNGVATGSFTAQNLYGNSPSGMPTSAPSSSSPTTLKSRLQEKGLYTADTTPTLWCF